MLRIKSCQFLADNDVRLTGNFNPGAPSKHLGSSMTETVEGFFRPSFSFPRIGSQKGTDLIH
jgi:hypothetical protein